MSASDHYFLQHEASVNSCLQYLRVHLLEYDKQIAEVWQYGMPFYTYKGKRICYLWFHKKWHMPYIGFVDGKSLEFPELLAEKRSRMKIFLLDANKDLPLKKINVILKAAIQLHV